MKQKPNPFLASLAIVTALIAVPVANAADRIWDATTYSQATKLNGGKLFACLNAAMIP